MSGLNLLVFRGDRRRASGKELKASPTLQLKQLCSHFSHRDLLGALLRAGEIECGVADAYPEAANCCERFTDQLADSLLASESAWSIYPDLQKPDFRSL